jgi:SAM-dependent methyltransferase
MMSANKVKLSTFFRRSRIVVNRRERLLYSINVAKCAGAEIGALCRPLVTRQDGRVFYVDHADTATLREKYRVDPDVDLDALVDVDVVWGERPLAEALEERVDYVVASHVVEHVPDLISWLGELASILRPGGEIRLAIPDRRFTFDYLRRETRLNDVVYAHMMRARTPLPHIVLDYVLNVVKVDGGAAWRGALQAETLERHHSLAHAMACATQAMNGVYHDVHCWVFTPSTFADLMGDLAGQGLAVFECTQFFDTAPMTMEFFVGLRPTADRGAAVMSWKAMSKACAK